MSSLYNLEPQPTAKVLLQTTSGDLLLELFAKQTPLTSRNFLQLCLDGYYNGTIFHRLVPGFVIQGGDPTGTGEGGEGIYDGGLFADEFHSRLKFNRRGLLGMANTGRKNDNGSQFFLTLGKTEELNGRNTMFGRIVGDTIYNLMKMGEADLVEGEGSERPLYPTKITGTEILVNPFDDLVASKAKVRAVNRDDKPQERKKPKKKAGKTLLSFGGDEGEDAMAEAVIKKPKFNSKLISAPATADEPSATIGKDAVPTKKITNHVRPHIANSASPPPKLNTHPETQLPLKNNEEPSRSPTSSPELAQVGKVSSLLDRTNAQIAELKASMKRNVPSAAPESARKKSALEQMIPETSMRGRKRKHGNKDDGKADAQALKILNAFRAKLDTAGPEIEPDIPSRQEDKKDQGKSMSNGNGVAEEDEEASLCDLHFIANCQSCKSWDEHMTGNTEGEDDDNKGWMSHALSFEKDRLGKDLTWKRKNEEELVVIDPREKAKDIKEEQRTRRLAKGGPSTKAWDKDRDRGRVPERMAGERG